LAGTPQINTNYVITVNPHCDVTKQFPYKKKFNCQLQERGARISEKERRNSATMEVTDVDAKRN